MAIDQMGLIKKYIYQKALSFMMYYHAFIEILQELLGNTQQALTILTLRFFSFHCWSAKKIFALPKLEMIHL